MGIRYWGKYGNRNKKTVNQTNEMPFQNKFFEEYYFYIYLSEYMLLYLIYVQDKKWTNKKPVVLAKIADRIKNKVMLFLNLQAFTLQVKKEADAKICQWSGVKRSDIEVQLKRERRGKNGFGYFVGAVLSNGLWKCMYVLNAPPYSRTQLVCD